jgi:hypothetical protein
MKTICITFIIFLTIFSHCIAADFPIDKGTFLTTGEFSFNNLGGELYEDTVGNRYTSITVDTSINYFLISHLAFGTYLEISYASQGDASSTVLGVGPQILIYFGSTQPQTSYKYQVYPFVSAGFYYLRNSLTSGGVSTTANGTMVSFGAGFTYMVTNTVGLSAEFLYHIDHLKFENNTAFNGNGFNIGVGFDIFIYG